jgi:hypothetical protein
MINNTTLPPCVYAGRLSGEQVVTVTLAARLGGEIRLGGVRGGE